MLEAKRGPSRSKALRLPHPAEPTSFGAAARSSQTHIVLHRPEGSGMFCDITEAWPVVWKGRGGWRREGGEGRSSRKGWCRFKTKPLATKEG